MLKLDTLRIAAEEFLASALTGDGWEKALTGLAKAADARGAVLLRDRATRVVGIMSTRSLADPVADFMAGRTPPNPRHAASISYARGGFRTDQDDYTRDELATEPFYQDFLRPIGFFWHANACLAKDGQELVAISLKRGLKSGPYEGADVSVLNAVLPQLRAATVVAHRILDAKAAGMSQVLHERGDPAFELDAFGRVLRVHAWDDSPNQPVRRINRRLVALDRMAQLAVDRGIHFAITAPQVTTVVPLVNSEEKHFSLQIVPVVGPARDIFLSTAAIAVLICHQLRRPLRSKAQRVLGEAFGLSKREAEVTMALGEGLNLTEVAERLSIGVGTARNHLKRIFEKTDTRRQAELIALLERLRP
jgi:DNA-binding CsgD family transcriptional regulator